MPQRPRICFLSDGDHHAHRFIQKMVACGYETHVVGFHFGAQAAGAHYYLIPRSTENEKGSRVTRDIAFLRSLYVQRRFLKNLLKQLRPDILHATWVPAHGLLAALSGYHPFLLMPYGSDILLMPRASRSNRWITRFTLRRADMITCDARAVEEEIVKLSSYPREKIVIFPWGIDMRVFNPSADGSGIRKKLGWETNKVVVMTRSLEPVYGLEYFLECLPAVIKAHPEVRVVLCGDGSLRGKLQGWVKEQGLDPYVHFAGRVAPGELADYLRAGDIYVSSSLSDGTSVSLLEAMACALPVVVSDVPANLEWITDGENGYVVPRRDSGTLQERLVHLLGDEMLQQRFGECNLEIARERANWDRNFERLEDMYRTLAKTKARS